MDINKAELHSILVDQIQTEIDITIRAAKSAHEAATHEELVAENKYDTKGLEASYLAGAQARRAGELEDQLDELKRLNLREFEDGPVSVCALVEVQRDDEQKQLVWILPSQGGYSLVHQDKQIQCISPGSPLGKSLIGKYLGDEFALTLAGKKRHFEILGLK